MKKSSIEIFELDKGQLELVFRQGYVDSFILNESLFSETLEHPYYRFISGQQLAHNSFIPEGPHFKGYILRATDLELRTIPAESLKAVDCIELQITKYKIAIDVLKRLNAIKSFQIIFDLKKKTPVVHLQKILQNLNFNKLTFPSRFYEINDENFKNWLDLESYNQPIYENRKGQPDYSVIVPHFESPHFVCNVLFHLSQVQPKSRLEVIMVDDGSKPETVNYILYFVKKHCKELSLAVYNWSRGPKVFRAGASRNYGAHFSNSENLIFLDSDMLVPPNFCDILDACFDQADVTQFKRLHIPPELSTETTSYEDILNHPSLFIEEREYWSPLFDADNWMKFENFWKFTCTYALAVKKKDFLDVGRFRRNFIRYGFEDTDLGYRLAHQGATFRIEKTPLLHLSNKMEKGGWYFRYQKMQRIKPMAQTFFRLNQDPRIYDSLRSLMD